MIGTVYVYIYIGSQNGHSYLVNIYDSNHSPTMTHASRNMSL